MPKAATGEMRDAIVKHNESINRIAAAQGRRVMRVSRLVVLLSVYLTGCCRSPSINVLGAYFPDWMFCIIAGVVIAIVFHVLARRIRPGHGFGPPALVYPAFVTLLALVVWLISFQH